MPRGQYLARPATGPGQPGRTGGAGSARTKAAQFPRRAVSVLMTTADGPPPVPLPASSRGEVMRYVLLIRSDETAAVSSQERSRRAAGLSALQEEMRASGALVGSEQLEPTETAATVQCWDGGDIVITGGPLGGTKEQIAGFLVVDGKDLDDAIGVATRIPAAWYGTIEVRPVRETEAS